MICCNPLKTGELWHHEILGMKFMGFSVPLKRPWNAILHGYFMAFRSLYSIFHGSWIWKFSQVFHGIFQVFFMALRPWKCHWFNHENPVKNLWIYNELFHKIFMGFEFIVAAITKTIFHVVSSWKLDNKFVYWAPHTCRIVWFVSLYKFRREIFGNQMVVRLANH